MGSSDKEIPLQHMQCVSEGRWFDGPLATSTLGELGNNIKVKRCRGLWGEGEDGWTVLKYSMPISRPTSHENLLSPLWLLDLHSQASAVSIRTDSLCS